MSIRKPISIVTLAALVAALFAFSGPAIAQDGGTTIASGFNGPQGILVAPDGTIWVIDSGVGGETEIPFVNPETGEDTIAMAGDTARVVMITPDGTQTVAATLPSLVIGQEASGGGRLALLDGVLYATSGAWMGAAGPEAPPNTAAIVKIADGQATEAAQTWPLERDQNPDGYILDSHPYGLTAGPDGMLWVVDSGANTLLKADPASGQVELATVFGGVPGPFPNPNRGNAMEADPVPTAVAFDGAGGIYVSYLPGAPFLPGSAKVVLVGADGSVSDYATGLTMVTDLRTGPDGELYAVQFGQFTEQGPVPNGVGAPGSGEVVMFAGLTSMAGSPLEAALAPPPAAASQEAASSPEALPDTGGTSVNSGLLVVALGLVLAAAGLGSRSGRVEHS